MKEKKLTIIASATLALVLCISAVVFFTSLSQDDLPDCTYKITKEQREMSTYDLLVWFCNTDYATEIDVRRGAIMSSETVAWSSIGGLDALPKFDDHQAYYELLGRKDIREACAKYYEGENYPDAFVSFCVDQGWYDVLGIDLSEVE